MKTFKKLLKVGGKDFSIYFISHQEMIEKLISLGIDQDIASDRRGFINYDYQEIFVRNDIHIDSIQEILIHEILHAVIDDSGLSYDSIKNSENINEVLVSILAPRFSQLIKDNELSLLINNYNYEK